jgi:AcrR family transcriptional regulator
MKKKKTPARERPYDNSRRAEQAQENRARIVEATLRLMAAGDDELTIPRIAAEAGLSVPTVYRNFATREELLATVDEQLTRSLGAPPLRGGVDELAASVPAIHAYFNANAETLRLVTRRTALRDVVDAGRRARDRRFEDMIRPAIAHLDDADARALVAVLRILTGSDPFLTMHDRFGLSAETSGRVVGWAVARLLEDASHHRGPLGPPPPPATPPPPRSDP